MLKKPENFIINCVGQLNGKQEIDSEKKRLLVQKRLKINDYLPAQQLGLDSKYKYLLKGGSGVDGCPMLKSLHGSQDLKVHTQHKKNRKFKKQRRLANLVNMNLKVIDVKTVLKEPLSENETQ